MPLFILPSKVDSSPIAIKKHAAGAVVDLAWEEEKLEATLREILEKPQNPYTEDGQL